MGRQQTAIMQVWNMWEPKVCAAQSFSIMTREKISIKSKKRDEQELQQNEQQFAATAL